MELLEKAVQKLDKNATRKEGDSDTLRRMTVVLESLTRKAGGTSISDAMCSSETGVSFRTECDVREVKALNNDLVVRSAYANVQGEVIKLRVKDLRRTAMASPFAAALVKHPHASRMTIVKLYLPHAGE